MADSILEQITQHSNSLYELQKDRIAVSKELADFEEVCRHCEITIVLDPAIDGKNAETRSAQARNLLYDNKAYTEALDAAKLRRRILAEIDAKIEHRRNRISALKLDARLRAANAEAQA